MKKGITLSLLILIAFLIFSNSILAETDNRTAKFSQQSSLTDDKISQIESWIKKNMRDGKIPGVSVVIVKGDKAVFSQGFGYSNSNTRSPVTAETLFELGSNSKAFTALGILNLEKEGLVNLNDPVKKYIPWFKMKYRGNYQGEEINDYVDITLSQLLHHTSGIPFKSIGDIPINGKDNALEETVKTQVDNELDFYPGEKFQYATLNYDILGLVIQNVSHMSYEDYVRKNIIEALGLNNSYLSRNEAARYNLADGYKIRFLKPVDYNAPVYRGNTPAGYIITNAKDLAKWIKIQLGTEDSIKLEKNLIDISHTPDRTVAPGNDGSSYAYGWSVFQDGGGMISHGGSNPNYSSYILFRPQEKIGIGILANLNSSYTEAIAKGINNIIRGEKPNNNISDIYISIDNASFTIVLISLPVALATIYLLFLLLIQIIKRERKYIGRLKRTIFYTSILLLFISGLGYCMYRIRDVLFGGLPWSFITVWAPQSLLIAAFSLFATITLFCFYFILATFFTKDNDKSLFIIAILSITSGLGNAIIIFIINEALNRNGSFQSGLLLFFILGIVIYVFGQRLVRIKLLTLTNDLVYNKRSQLISKVLGASYEKVEQMEDGKIHAVLNNDTEIISNFANITISAITSIVTLICCFIYLGIINFYGLLVSILIILITAGLYFIVSQYANRLWKETRDMQNEFFKFMNSLISGFKELKMHRERRNEFSTDMQISCMEYRDKRIKGDLSFANVFIIGELLFTSVIGVVAFIFPTLFTDIQTSSLRNYIFVFLYMTGPVHGVLNSIPEILRIRISYTRLNELISELEAESKEVTENSLEGKTTGDKQLELKLINVEYSYKNNRGDFFKVGPINCSFKSGEITFIIGGNGSGKSTLAKLLSGLYKPDNGKIILNSNNLNSENVSENYSAIFSDYYLFEKLYGIDYEMKRDKINELLKILQIDDKLQIENGVLSTTKLSSGQKKRLALLVSYLEDRPICVFDECAADQDPEFRKFFYNNLLPELRAKGKCIIAITHDDRYFNYTDNIIKMEEGRVSIVETDHFEPDI